MISRREFLRASAVTPLSLSAGGVFAPSCHATAAGPWVPWQDQDVNNAWPAATAKNALLVATTAPTAIEEGITALRAGGTAADAVLTTALAQIAICAGCWVSYAGRMTAVYFDASTGEVSALNACYDAPRQEDDPLSIPRQGTPSGRSALIPGFMAGVEALHQRFGLLDFSRLFEPSIRLAEEGFPLTRNLASLIRGKAAVLTRYEGGRRVFNKPNGELYSEGELFRQPDLARTLNAVAADGAKYCYTGDWAKAFVSVVQAEGGKITLEDLEEYEPTWEQPLTTKFAENTVHMLPSPNLGGPLALFSLNLANAVGMAEMPHYSQDIEALALVLRIEQAMRLSVTDRGRQAIAGRINRDELPTDALADASVGRAVGQIISDGSWDEWWNNLGNVPQPSPSEHSDAVVCADPTGNVAAILHTINTGGWGTTGLFVDGFSIPDSAANQQRAVVAAGPGGRISDYGPPLIATHAGQPILASSATGSGNINVSWQCVLGALAQAHSPQEAADLPNFQQGIFETGKVSPELIAQIENLGIEIGVANSHGNNRGYWAGIAVDRAEDVIRGGKIRVLDGKAIGY